MCIFGSLVLVVGVENPRDWSLFQRISNFVEIHFQIATMEYGNLVCNFKDCYKELKDTVYVTFCSHIVCAQHGEKMKLNVPGVCLVCKESLEGHQIVEQNLKITKNSIKVRKKS